ncbi:protease modulator HflC, partial [Escherichia coli]|uniref:protease modulator HflC n=1 Tax=Escherichia coli TaxID=562 RepID=UPI000A866DEC
MRKSVIAIIIIVLVVLYMSVFVVKEGERGITLRFGKVLRDDDNKPLVYEPGLHFKIPFIETVKMLDARIQTMDNQADRFVTKEKKDLIVDSYIKWRISDFSRYYLATGGGDISQAEVLLKRKFSDRLRSEIGRLDVKDIVTDSRGRLTLEVRDALCRFGNGVICCRGSNFIFCTRRTGVQRVTYFEGQTTTGIGDDIFHVQATNF